MTKVSMFEDVVVVSVRFERKLYNLMMTLAAHEAIQQGKTKSVVGMIRDACNYVYNDGELMRDCFRRSRVPNSKKMNKSLVRKETL